MTLRAIAFDLDNVLAFTEEHALSDLVDMFNEEYGIAVTLNDFLRPGGYRGLGGQVMLDAIKRDFNIDIPLAQFIAKREPRVIALFKRVGIKAPPNLAVALKLVKQSGLRFYIVSNSSDNRIANTLSLVGGEGGDLLRAMFGKHNCFSVESTGVAKGKPHPDLYAKAAELVGIPPSDTLAIEDTVHGAGAAVKAGFTTLGYTGLVAADMKQTEREGLLTIGAVRIFDDWAEFPAILQEYQAKVA